MTGSPHAYPPPGAQPPEEHQGAGGPPPGAPVAPAPVTGPPAPQGPAASYPRYDARPGSPGAPVPGMLGAAHKPGAIPLRPLGLGNIYDGAFRIIRFNPKATVGAAFLVTAIAMVIPIVVSAVIAFTVGTGIDANGEFDENASTAETLGLIGSVGTLFLGSYAAQLGVIFVTGMVAHITHAAAVGRRLSLAEAWAATHGKRWRLVGQTFVVGLASLFAIVVLVALVVGVAVITEDVLVTVLVGIALVLGTVPLLMFLWIRVVYLATPALMLEGVGIFGSFGRSWRLTAHQFWRTLGIALLTALITAVASNILGVPFAVGSQVGALVFPEYFILIITVGQAISLIIQNAFVAPFTATVASLQYLDQRMRKEAYDVELMREARLIPR